MKSVERSRMERIQKSLRKLELKRWAKEGTVVPVL
jgi:hypothetical protein